MHTRNNGGIDTDVATGLDANFAWIPPLASQSQVDDGLEGPESLTEDGVAVAFDEIEPSIAEFPSVIDPQLEGWERLSLIITNPDSHANSERWASQHLRFWKEIAQTFVTSKVTVRAKITVITPAFEETRARFLRRKPYIVALHALSTLELERPIYVDGMMRYFIVDGLQKAAPGVRVMSAPPNSGRTNLQQHFIRAVQAQMYIGIGESQVRAMIDEALAAAGLTERWALVLFGEDVAPLHGSGSDRALGEADFILISRCWWRVAWTFMLHSVGTYYDLTLAHVVARDGVNTSAVDKIARGWLDGRGYKGYFNHRRSW
ncbi:hypothetical protein BDR05DRAFT_944599 [Suillus weaverae]|nr:hypothetical protein BDR05DRAFT_944599 [Suillus weaverae]